MSSPMRFVCLSLVILASACEGGSGFLKTNTSFYPSAQKNYEVGVQELKSQNWLTALQYFQHVRTTFGFSKWATLAELGIADADVGREKYTEAIDGYKQFIKA